MEGHFYYSKKQEALNLELFERGMLSAYSDNYAEIDGKIVRYSECQRINDNAGSNWDDAVYLGKGVYHHAENYRTSSVFAETDVMTQLLLNLEACRLLMNLDSKKEDYWAEIIDD